MPETSPTTPPAIELPGGFAALLAGERAAYQLPPDLPDTAERLIHASLALLVPHFTRGSTCRADAVEADAAVLVRLLEQAMDLPGVAADVRHRAAAALVAALPGIRAALLLDAAATADGDPAASGVDEVVLAYPGFFATAVHRIAQQLVGDPVHRGGEEPGVGQHHLVHARGGRVPVGGVALLPRLLGELAHRATGIDIHPGATIGGSFAIDHGTGVVVGATCEIGERVRLYQGVTLGALVVSKDLGSRKRHPTVQDDVVVYSGATILGGDTVIGRGSRIGGNVWLTRSVPPGSVVSTSAGMDRRRSPGAQGGREASDPALEFHL
jgi:serine O-acetyltransferase